LQYVLSHYEPRGDNEFQKEKSMQTTNLYNSLWELSRLPTMEQTKIILILVFSCLVGIAFLVSLVAMVVFKLKDKTADIGPWLNLFLTCLGYIIGILTGLLGIPVPAPHGP
jgi:hypothetical protein